MRIEIEFVFDVEVEEGDRVVEADVMSRRSWSIVDCVGGMVGYGLRMMKLKCTSAKDQGSCLP